MSKRVFISFVLVAVSIVQLDAAGILGLGRAATKLQSLRKKSARSHRQISLSAANLTKMFGPSVLINEIKTVEKKPSRFVTQPDD